MNIILGVTGSIACYKSYDLLRKLIKRGHKVKVILTSGSLKFIKAQTFHYLGAQEVFLPHDDFTPEKSLSSVLHIDLVKWCDKILIAPTSANTISRIAMGLTNDLLTSVLLANSSKPVLIFPAMNSKMWNHLRIQSHLREISNLPHYAIINPVKGKLACGDEGSGKLLSINTIVHLAECLNPKLHIKIKILITAGATSFPLDPVRFLTNPSTGKMGFEIAKAFLSKGYFVHLVAGHRFTKEISHLLHHPHFQLSEAPTTHTMRDCVLDLFPTCDLYISSAAIADIHFERSSEKIKKESLHAHLAFQKAPDILKEVIQKKTHQKIIGFAAETETTEDIFSKKMVNKPVDLLVGNKVSNNLDKNQEPLGFQVNNGKYYFIEKQNKTNSSLSFDGPHDLTKTQIAFKLLHWFQNQT